MSTRVDLFPQCYTDKLAKLQDDLPPMPAELARAVVREELPGGQPLSELFDAFDDEPLGSASIAQVHRATLKDARVVAVKIQRPAVVPTLRGDVANLKSITKKLRGKLPVDYYVVFSELGDALENELDFLSEAQATLKILSAVAHDVDGAPKPPPLAVPRPIPGLATTRVLVMEFVDGVPLTKAREKLLEKGLDPDGPESQLFGRRLLTALTEAFEAILMMAPRPAAFMARAACRVKLKAPTRFTSRH